jgi:SAM-dependent methyltransferase
MNRPRRLSKRKLKIWSQDYLVYRYLWPNIEQAAQEAIAGSSSLNPLAVLDIGCGHKPYRDLFPNCNYLGLDWGVEDSSPDLVGDAMNLPISSESVDIVFSTQVIEHLPKPQLLVNESSRVLKRNGYLILTGPLYWPLHEEPHDFYRFTKYGFAHLLKEAGFREWQIQEDGTDWAQFFLNLSLRFGRRWQAPFRCVANLAGSVLDHFGTSRKSPSNYTVLAKR